MLNVKVSFVSESKQGTIYDTTHFQLTRAMVYNYNTFDYRRMSTDEIKSVLRHGNWRAEDDMIISYADYCRYDLTVCGDPVLIVEILNDKISFKLDED